MTEKNKMKTISKKDFDVFLNALIADTSYEVIGVKAKENKFVFDELFDASDLRLDYDVTILPPKKYFLPQYEKLMQFDLNESFNVKKQSFEKKRIIVGMHPYDIIALEQTDKVYLDSQEDNFYKKRRENTLIIGSDILNVSPRSFAKSMNTNVTDKGFDLLLTDISDKYVIAIGSKKGEKLLDMYAKTDIAQKSDIEQIHQLREKTSKRYIKKINSQNIQNLPKLLSANYNNDLWQEKSRKCMECGSCTMVCPTCYCYDIQDTVSLNLKNGERIRTWDGCLLRDFTAVAGNEVFRDDIKERYRHRFYRKINYLPARYGFVACVGCGRCGIACLPDIADPCDVINDLLLVGGEESPDKFYIKKDSKIQEEGVIHVPRSATIKRVEKQTENETFFELELDDGKPLNHDPGQFVEVSVFGIGEAPYGISSAPNDSPRFDIVVRNVGNVSKKLVNMKKGQKLGIRGPLGVGFDMKSFEGKNLLLASGGTGVIPMRSLIQYVKKPENRKKYKNVTILHGCKEPSQLLFPNEVDEWKECSEVECTLTVDQCPEGECWEGDIGLITNLFSKIKLDAYDSKNTIAIVIGPPVMYKFVIKCLQTLGIPDKNIWVSLERRMKCGVGKCGHCQINGVYCCKEGPVFNYEKIKELPEAF
ncbi:MAG: 4Fe-4S dicluster domain-containing protein [Thermoplasmatota archaeon]